jgi:cyclophilin family peptidyl-prolyl cis-trans isomerase/HEAT repeat protein
VAPPDPLSRIETLARILVLEDSRTLGDGSIQAFLRQADPAIRRRAVLAAGLIGDLLVVPQVIPLVQDPEVEVRRAAVFALGLLGSAESVAALTAALSDADPLVRGRSSEALSRIPSSGAGTAIVAAFLRALPPSQGGALRIRGDDPGRTDDPWVEMRLHLVALARLKDVKAFKSAVIGPTGEPRVDWWVSVWGAMRIADPELSSVLIAGATAEDPHIRSLAARGLGSLKDRAYLGLLRQLAGDRDPGVVRQALRAVATIGSGEGTGIAAAQIDSPNLGLRREALLALAALPRDSRWRSRVIDSVGHQDPWVRSAAWPALVRMDAEDVGIVLSTTGPDSDWHVREALASGLAETLGERATPLLLPMLKDPDARVVPSVLLALAKARGPAAVPLLLEYVQHSDAGARAAAIEALSSLDTSGDPRLAAAFSRAFDTALASDDLETRMAVVDGIVKHASDDSRTLLRRIAASDPARVVRQRALNGLGDGFASPEDTALRIADARRLVSIYEPGAELRYSPRVLISTRHGKIELALDIVDAPLTSMSFVRLAHAGFFNGLTFHRVVPGFVVQGGDPRGDGYGGPGASLRCELNGRPFGRGALGMALSGKDTGGSQFFITIEPQPHLDGAYTQFGQVLSGMEVVEKIRPGDVIERIDVFDGRDLR